MTRGIAAAVVASVISVTVAAQVPGGQTIRAKDGDVILVEHNDKVKIVRRRQANVRVLHNVEERWVLILADWQDGPGAADGRVDYSFHFRELTGEWPLGARWEGSAFVDQYGLAGSGPNSGMGLTTPGGLVQLLGSVPEGRSLVPDRTFADPSAIAVLTFRGSGSSVMREPFDVAEQRALTRMTQESRGGPVGAGPGEMRSSLSVSVSDAPPVDRPSQPVRAGSSLRTPQKIKHVDAVTPEEARRAGVRGLVIVEVTVGADGTVQQARVLRSIPLLDQAAIEAVKQWVYEPTYLNGQPVPVIVTAAVDFR